MDVFQHKNRYINDNESMNKAKPKPRIFSHKFATGIRATLTFYNGNVKTVWSPREPNPEEYLCVRAEWKLWRKYIKDVLTK